MDTAALVGAGLACIGGLVWAVRIEGKVLAHDREIEQLGQHTDDKIDQLRADIAYIRQRIDKALEERSR